MQPFNRWKSAWNDFKILRLGVEIKEGECVCRTISTKWEKFNELDTHKTRANRLNGSGSKSVIWIATEIMNSISSQLLLFRLVATEAKPALDTSSVEDSQSSTQILGIKVDFHRF